MDALPQYVFEGIWNGRAILIAGQDLARGETARLLGSDTLDETLHSELLKPSDVFLDRVTSLRASLPDSAHVEVAQAPWALVLSTALDTRLASALEAAAPGARRVRRRFINDVDADALIRGSTILEVMHLSLFSNASSADGILPDPSRWARATRLMQPRVLDRLKDTVGPAHIVILDGLNKHDPLDLEDLVTALEGLDDTQIVLCAVNDIDVAWLLAARPNVVVVRGSAASLLRQARVGASASPPPLLQSDDLAISVRGSANNERLTVVFRADELRDIRRHVEIIGDAPGLVAPAERDARLSAFRSFIRTPRLRPDYEHFFPEFCLERKAYVELSNTINRRLTRLQGASKSPQRLDGPVLLAGYPGSGRTTGLHWLGARMRREGWLIAQFSATIDEPNLFAIEQVIRLIEQRLKDVNALAVVILIADGIGLEGARRLDERLRRAGRRAIVIASGVPYHASTGIDEEPQKGTEISLNYQLDPDELRALDEILTRAGITVELSALNRQAGVEGFLGLLDRLDPGAREGLAQVLRQDFDRFISDTARVLRPGRRNAPRGSFGDALAAAFAAAKLHSPQNSAPTVPSPADLDIARDFLRTIFALAWLDRAAPLDLLGRKFPELFSSYEDVRIVALEHGFLRETAIDRDGTPALAAINPGVGRALRHHVVGYTPNVLGELKGLTDVVSWPAGEKGELDTWARFIFELLRAVSPRGPFGHEFGSADDVKRLLNILRDLRVLHGLHLPQTLMLEAITEREWVDRSNLSSAQRDEALDQSRNLLEQARDVVASRPRSLGRDHLLASVLTAYATTLRRLMEVRIERDDLAGAQNIAAPALTAAQRAQALQDNWHPFDAAALIYYRLATAWRAEKGDQAEARSFYIDAVDKLGEILDLGAELGELSPDQHERQADRQREYLVVTDQLELAREQALSDAREGKLQGLCYLVRLEAVNPVTNRIRSCASATSAFETLAAFPTAFDDERSVVLLLRLWVGARLSAHSLDAGPFVINAADDEWRQLERLARRRLQLSGDEFDSAIGFWLAAALLQLGNAPEARRTLQQMQLSIGRTRKRQFDPLLVLSQAGGGPRLFRALVRRREERENLSVYVRDLDLEMSLPRRHLEAGEAIDLRQGDTVEVHVALNYRGPMAIGPRWGARAIRNGCE